MRNITLSQLARQLHKKRLLIAGCLLNRSDNEFIDLLSELDKLNASLVIAGLADEEYKDNFDRFVKKRNDLKGLMYTQVSHADPVAQKKLTDYVLGQVNQVSVAIIIENGCLPEKLTSNVGEITSTLKIPFIHFTKNGNQKIKASITISNDPNLDKTGLYITSNKLNFLGDNSYKKTLYLKEKQSNSQIITLTLKALVEGHRINEFPEFFKKELEPIS